METIDSRMIINSSVLYSGFPLNCFFEQQRRKHINRVELYGAVPHVFIDHYGFGDTNSVSGMAGEYGITVAVFTPKPYGYSLFADPSSDHAGITLEYYKNCIRAALILQSKTVCLIPANGILSKGKSELSRNLTASLSELCSFAEDCGVKLALGIAPRSEAAFLCDIHEMSDIYSSVQKPSLGIMVDTHIISNTCASVVNWVLTFGNLIEHIHLSDGCSDGYRVWGEGCYPLEALLQLFEKYSLNEKIGLYVNDGKYFQDPLKADSKNFNEVIQAAK